MPIFRGVKREFPGYYRPTTAEFDTLWAEALFVIDANVLLNVYGYSSETRETLLTILENIADRVWIPHQFASEYQKNRGKAIIEQVNHYRNVARDLRRMLDEHFRSPHRHPFITKKSLKACEQICTELAEGEKQHWALLTDDPYFDRITVLLDGKVGAPTPAEQLKEWYEEGAKRYTEKIPPGFSDEKKPVPERYGDYIGWRQILAHAKAADKAVIFVTADLKEDWWHVQSDREMRIGPRPELVAEFLGECQKTFYMYALDQFMTWTQEKLEQHVESSAIEEVRERSKAPDPRLIWKDVEIKSVGLDALLVSEAMQKVVAPLVVSTETSKPSEPPAEIVKPDQPPDGQPQG